MADSCAAPLEKRNELIYSVHCKISEIKGCSIETVAFQTTKMQKNCLQYKTVGNKIVKQINIELNRYEKTSIIDLYGGTIGNEARRKTLGLVPV